MEDQYTLIRSHRKTISLTVTRDAAVVVRAPLRMPVRDIDNFVKKHDQWIRRHRENVRKSLEAKPDFNYRDGDIIYLLGKPLRLCAVPGPEDGCLVLPPEGREAAVEAFLRKQAAQVIPGRVEELGEKMGLRPAGVKITGAKTRWGSCSGKNSLCFSFRLICLPPGLVDAVVVHELAHIRIKNHSERFYREVERIMPDYPILRRQMKEFAAKLTV